MTDVDLKRELAAMLGDEPGGGFDSNRALRSGRRHQLRRRMGSAAAVAAIAVFAIAVPVIIDQARDDGAAVAPGTSASASDSVASTPTATPSQSEDTPTPTPTGITSSPAELKALLKADTVDTNAVDDLIGDVIAQATGGTVEQTGASGASGGWQTEATYLVTRDGVSWTVQTGMFEDLGTDYCLQIPEGGSCDSVDTADGGILVTQVDPDLRGSGVTEVTQQRFRPGVSAWVNGIGAVAGPDGSLFSDDLSTFTGTPTDYNPKEDLQTYASIAAFLIDGMPNANQLGSLG